MENDFVEDNHDNIKPQQHCNNGKIHLNNLGSKILADNFDIALDTLTWHRIFQENDALRKYNHETESNSKFLNNSSQDTLENKGKSHRNFQNLSFSFSKKTKPKYPKNLFFGHLNINSIRKKLNQFRKSYKIPLTFSSLKKVKLIPSQQLSIPEYRIFRKDRNAHGGRLLFLC